MESVIVLLGLTILVFASTNIDDLFVLLGFFSDPSVAVRDVAIGQYIGIAVLYSISLIASLISMVIPPVYIGLLGLAPVAIGLKQLVDQLVEREKETARRPAEGSGVLSVAVVTISNGGDNIGVYTPFFATHSCWQIGVVGVIFGVMTGVWCAFGYWLVNHPIVGSPIRRYGRKAAPIVLIGLGLLILRRAGILQLLGV
jgi:cadmium resistance protein CadD (predicted permease)